MISPYDAGFLFVFKAWRRAHSWDYVTEAATLKTGKKTHKMGISFASKSLSRLLPVGHRFEETILQDNAGGVACLEVTNQLS